MSNEDVIQISDLFYGDFAIDGVGVMTSTVTKGRGTFVRTGVGAFRWELPEGEGMNPGGVTFEWCMKNLGPDVSICLYDIASSTPTAHVFIAQNSFALDPSRFSIRISRIQP